MSDFIYSRQKIISQLISARLEKGLSQEQLAKLIDTAFDAGHQIMDGNDKIYP